MTTPQQIIERLYQIKENPGIYKSLSAEEQADILLFILTPKPLLKKTATVKLEKGERGERGIDGTNSLTEAQQTAILADLVGKIKVENGKDAVVTTAMLEGIVAEVISRIELPDLEQVVTTTITADPTAIRNSLELLNDEERLKQSAIDNLPEDLQKIRDAIVALPRAGGGIGKNQVYNFIREAVVDGTIPAGGGGATSLGQLTDVVLSGLTQDARGNYILSGSGGSSVTTFETINKNLLSYNVTATTESATLITQTYNGPNGDIIKSISFDSSGLPTTIVLSGDTPAGINLTKTFDFSSQEIPLITYS